MAHPLDALLNKKLILLTGKGGVGKTAVAGLLACHAVSQGKRVCIVECSHEDQITPLFGRAAIGHHTTEIYPNIFAINLDLDLNFRDFIVKQLGFEQLFEKIFQQSMVRNFIDMIPGLKELTLLGRLFYECNLSQKKFDLVIYDGFSSGHFLNLMTTPDAISRSGVGGPILKETHRVQEFLSDQKQVGILLITQAQNLILSEALELGESLSQYPVALDRVVINRLPHPVKGSLCEKSLKSLKNAPDFLKNRSEKSHVAVSSFLKQWSDHKDLAGIGIDTLNDWGSIPEPLDVDQAQPLLASWDSLHRAGGGKT